MINFVEEMDAESFHDLVYTIVQAERIFHAEDDAPGRLKTTSIIHLWWYHEWLRKGRPGLRDDMSPIRSYHPKIDGNYQFKPYTEEQLKTLHVPGLVALAYLRATKEMYEDIHGYP